MIDAARANYPGERFRLADAAQLPYEDGSFDAMTCSFGLSHMEYPQAAVSEAFRVLKAGGRFAFTLWCGADDGGELQAIGRDAIAKYAVVSFTLPNSWTQLRFADESACENAVKQAGFNSPQFRRLPIVWQSTKANEMLDFVDKLSVRTRMILDSQTLTSQQRIREHILSETEARRVDGIISIRWPALLTVVSKPS
jgi:ubiquinone/menaquinone biosynthesis C-methylase UbiE